MEPHLFHFGKYKGKDVFTIIRQDPQYVSWCLENVKSFYLSGFEYRDLQEQLAK